MVHDPVEQGDDKYNSFLSSMLILRADASVTKILILLLGRRQANLCFHFAGSEENLPDIAKPHDASMGRKQNSFLF